MQKQVKEFLRFLTMEKGYSNNTIAAYRNDLTQLMAYLASQTVSSWQDVDPEYLQNYIEYLKEQGYASSTVARKVAAAKSFFHFLVAEKTLKDDPTVTVDSPSVDKHLPRTLSPEEMALLLAEPDKSNTSRASRDKALLELMYATGMRASEIISLDVSAVDLQGGIVRCRGKGNKERVIPLYERAIEALSAYMENGRARLLQAKEETALFVNHRGQPLTRQGLWLLVREYAIAAGIKHNVTPHTIRHTFAIHLLDGGTGLRRVQQLLGHSNISSTQIYIKISDQRQ